jgi:uncharacterized UPF0146 family protein
MKNSTNGIITVFLLFLSSSVFSQDYSQLPTQVQQKMDDNKLAGINLYTGILAVYEVSCTQLTDEKIMQIQQKAQQNSAITSVTKLNETQIKLISFVSFSLKELKNFLAQEGVEISNCTTSYILQ